MKTWVKLYTIYTSDGGYWLDPDSPFITTSELYAEAILKLYLQHSDGNIDKLGTDDAKVVELSVDEKVFNGTDERGNRE